MIWSLHEWLQHGAVPRADVCIVGAGPAGIELAVQLARGGRQVLVLEGGERLFDARRQKLHAHRESGLPLLGGNHDFRAGSTGVARDAVRIRQFGGTSTVWSGKWKLPDPIDFETRPWLSGSGWPISFSEIDEHALGVMRDYGVPHESLRKIPVSSGKSEIVFTRHFEQAPALDFGARHFAFLQQSPNIQVVLDANAIEMLPETGASVLQVEAVRVRSLDGETAYARADCFVLAVGGIETPRLLLLSDGFGKDGAGNDHGLVGKGLMDHPKARLGTFEPTRQAVRMGMIGRRHLVRAGVQTRWTLPKEMQRELRIPNHSMAVIPSGPRRSLLDRLVRVPPVCEAYLFLEQMPCEESFIGLDSSRDELGVPLPRVHWAFEPEAEAGVRRFVSAVLDALEPHYGKLRIDESALSPSGWASASHPIGTTRMATAPERGVVDVDCRVFGIGNLYVAGSALFPVGGNANPTLLLLALARRLGARLLGLG